MAITTLETISLWDIPPNVSGAHCYGYLDQVSSWELTRRLDAAHAATVTIPIDSLAAPLVVQRRILALHFAPTTPGSAGEVMALRISETSRSQGPEGLLLRITARSLLFDWGDAGPLSYRYPGGKHEFSITGAFPVATWMAEYALPHLQRQGYDWYAFAGTNALQIPRTFTRETALQLLNGCQTYLGQEVLIRPFSGVVSVEVVQAVNDALPPLRLSVGRNIRRLAQGQASNEQATVLVAVGGKGHSDSSSTIQGLAFGSVSENVGLKQLDCLPVSDSAWLVPIVQMDGQYVDPLGQRTWHLQRIKTGRLFAITTSVAAGPSTFGGRFTLSDLTLVPFGYLWALREGRLTGTELDVASPGYPLQVSGAPVGNVVTLANPFSAADPVPTDDEHVDCRVRRSSLVLATTSTTVAAVAGSTTDVDVTVASTAGVVAGDWGFAHNNVATPWTLFGKVFQVVQVISGTVVRVRKRYSFDTTATPFSVGAMAKQVRFYRAVGTVYYVNDEVAAANTITLDTAAGVVANDLLEYQIDSAAELLTGVPSPQVATYGIVRKEKPFATARCLPNLLQNNPAFSSWAGANPDNWTFLGAGSATKITTNLPGPGLVNAAKLLGSSGQTLTSPTFWARPTSGNSKLSVRVRLRTDSGIFWDGASASHITTISVLVPGGATLYSQVYVPPNYPSKPANYIELQPDTTYNLDCLAIDLLHTPGAGAKYAPWDGLQVRISVLNGGGNITVGGVFATLDSTMPSDAWMSEWGNVDLIGLGNAALATLDEPETTNEVDAFDLSRALGAEYSADEIVEGRTVRVEAEALNLAFEDRIAQVTYRGTEDGTVAVQVTTRTRQFADVLANYLVNT